jgi:alpha-D-ribose 1-methylphosphonate 5-triphosphate synthase subunit PhnG
MAILKSRFGKDGVVFEDIVFNNATIQIDMGEKIEVIRVEYKVVETQEKKKAKANRIMDAAKQRKKSFRWCFR